MQSDVSFVGYVLVDIAIHAVLIFAIVVFAASHEVKKAWHVYLHLLVVSKSAFSVWKLAFSQRVEDAGFAPEVVGKPAFVALGAIVFVIEFAANVFGGLGLDNLSFDGVREEAVEAVLAVPHVEVDAGIVAPINMELSALGALFPDLSCAFADREVLIRAEPFDGVQFSL